MLLLSQTSSPDTNGMLQSLNCKQHELRKFGAQQSEAGVPYLDFFIERYREAFDAEIDAFIDSVQKGLPVEPGSEDGRKALVLAEAALISAAEGRMVRIDEIV